MQFSKYTIFSKIRNSDNYYLVNLLTGNADIISADKALEIQNSVFSDVHEFVEKGYLVDEKEEKRLYNEKYLDFLDDRESDEIQIFFVPWYTCNFDCSYCYQSEYNSLHRTLTRETIDAFFRYIQKTFASRKKYITLFGGEPLLTGTTQKSLIEWFFSRATEAGLQVAVVSNGYTIPEYLDVLKAANIREVQITLDGVETGHDERRYLKNGSPTFEKIVRSIDLLIENQITVNLRMVLDKGNMHQLAELSRFAVQKGWTKSPFFKTQLGRNYELHYCQEGNQKLMSRIEFYEAIYQQVVAHPEIIEFHKPAFSIAKFLFENGELPPPLFDACTGCKTEWAFDYTGHIFACTATVGKPGESLGTFYPEVNLSGEKIAAWEERDVTSIEQCKSCSLQLACGGGCAAVASNRTGNLLSPDCRPVAELIGMGISYYHSEE